MGNEIALLPGMILSGGMIFRGMRFIWAIVLMLTIAGVTDGWAATKPAKPKITVQPVSMEVDYQESATFTVSLQSALGVTYQWRRNKLPITGANASSYTIPAVEAADNGEYDVVITGAAGATTSRKAMLTVIFAPDSFSQGTALYGEFMTRTNSVTRPDGIAFFVKNAESLTDPGAPTIYYHFDYTRLPNNQAYLFIFGHLEPPGINGGVGVSVMYRLTFTGINDQGERVADVTGNGEILAPPDYKPKRTIFISKGTMSFDLDGETN